MFKRLGPGCSNGKVLQSFDTSGFIMTEIAYSAGSRLAEHSHENAHYCFVLEGTYTESHDKEELYCQPSTLTFRPPGELHEDKFHNRDVRVFTLEIPSKWLERLRQDSLNLGRSINFQSGTAAARLSERVVREFHQMNTAAGLVIEGLALEIMAETVRYAAQDLERTIPPWLKRAKDLIRSRFAENLTLDEIASEAGVHPVHLASVFRRKFQCTIGEYIRSLRIEYACRELAASKTPLAIIALEAGFANQGHFSAAFKRLTGQTPASYRNSFRQT